MKFHWKIRIQVSRGKTNPGIGQPSVKVVDVQIPPARVPESDAKLLAMQGNRLQDERSSPGNFKRFVVAMVLIVLALVLFFFFRR